MLYEILKTEIGTIVAELIANVDDGKISNYEKLTTVTTLAGCLNRIAAAIPKDETERRAALVEVARQLHAEHLAPLAVANIEPLTLSVLDRFKAGV